MKKTVSLIAFLLVLCLVATAMATTLKPMKSKVKLKDLSDAELPAQIAGYADGKLTVTLFETEPYERKKVEKLKAGDKIVTQGETVEIHDIDVYDGFGTMNESVPGGKLYFYYDYFNNYILADDYGKFFYRELGTVDCPLADDFVFSDRIDRETGEMLDLGKEYTLEELLAVIEEETENDGVGFNETNTTLYFDSEGKINVIERIYTPWQ